MSPIRRHGWSVRLLAATVILALTLPMPAQAFAQALSDQRAAADRANRWFADYCEGDDTPSRAANSDSRSPSPRPAASPSEVLAVPLLPKRVESLSARGGADPWQLFDGNSSTALTPASSEPVSFAVDLQDPRALSGITILGPTEGTLSLFAQDGLSFSAIPGLEAVRVHVGTNEWRRISVDDPTKISRLVVKWTPISLTGPAEIGLWGRWQPPRDATDPVLADRILADAAPGALVAQATPDRVTATRVALGAAGPQDGVVHVQLSADPRSWAHAFLVYELTGLGHFTQAVRQINGLSPRGGAPVRGNSGGVEGGLQVEEISPDWLKLGDNEIRFLPLAEAGAPEYSVRRVRILGTGHSSLYEARMADAKRTATASTQHFTLDRPSQAHDLVFELLEPSAGRIAVRATGANAGAPQYVDLQGRSAGWHHVRLDSLPANATAIDVSVDRAAGGGSGRGEGRLSPVSEVVVTASPLPSDADARAIAISYPLHGECRNGGALVTGFIAPPRGELVVALRANGEDVSASLAVDNSFALKLAEPSNKQKSWSAVLEAKLSSGKLVRRTVKLDSCVDDAVVANDATVEDEGAPYAQLVRAGEQKTIAFAGAKLEIPAGALDHDVRITVRPLVADQVPDPAPRVNNATPEHRAYRFGPNGLKFKKPVKLTLPYDAAALNQGQTERELFAYYYDKPLGSWQRIGRYDVASAGSLTSLTEHFTDFIAATLAMPDEPGIKSFNSNEMKGIKTGDPGAGVDLIAPPTANSSGAMNLHYLVELPPGRNGIEPTLAFTYNSEKPNGWLGMGWDLRLPTIEADGRFGVPRYDEVKYGRDHYQIDGEEIVPSSAASNTYVRRVESSFDTIVRNVTGNCVTSWTVTDKHGRAYTYGGPGAVLAQPGTTPVDCNVFRWALSSVKDTFGNQMVYTYETVRGTAAGSGEDYRELYPSKIEYTSHVSPALAAAYRVEFFREPNIVRPDVIISGRPGFQERTSYRLDHVDVSLVNAAPQPATLIRRYQLAYEAPSLGHFYKSLLTSIGQLGLGGVKELDQHTFQYGGAQAIDVNGTPGIEAFGTQTTWGSAPNGSALSRTEDTMGGGSGTVGIGLPIVSFTVSAGANGGSDNTRLALQDFNGDGLPDLAASDSAFMNFLHPELSNFPGDTAAHLHSLPVAGIDSLGHTGKSGWSINGGVSFSGLGVTVGYTSTSTDDDAVMADIDGDGWVDRAFVSNNQLHWLKNDGTNHFTDASSTTNNNLAINSKDPNKDYIADAGQNGGLARINPLVRWTAPFGGPVTIKNSIQKQNAGGNGVDVSIFKATPISGGGWTTSTLWAHSIDPSDTSLCFPTGTSGCSPMDPAAGSPTTTVAFGDALFFMTAPHHDPSGSTDQLALESLGNQVLWDPLVKYNDQMLQEPYGLPVYQFSQQKDFRLLRPEVQWVASADGDVRVYNPSSFDPAPTRGTASDEVEIHLYLHPHASPNTSIEFPSGGLPKIDPMSAATINIDQTVTVEKGDSITIEIKTDTPVDLNQLGLNPRIQYTRYCRNITSSTTQYCNPVSTPIVCSKSAADQPLKCPIPGDPESGNPISTDILSQPAHLSYRFPQFIGAPTQAFVAPSPQTVTLNGSLGFSFMDPTLAAAATVVVQGVNKSYLKKKISGDGIVSINNLSVALQTGDELMVNVYSEQPVTPTTSTLSGIPVNWTYRDPHWLELDANNLPKDPMSGGFHHWSDGFYNGDLAFTPNNIYFPLDANNNPVSNPTVFFFGVPQHDNSALLLPPPNLSQSWSGPGGAYIAPGQFSASRGSSRLGNGGGAGLNSLRHASTWNFELGAQFGVSLGVNKGRTSNDHEFMDLNGDRWPDAISADGTVQYGDGKGGFIPTWTTTIAEIKNLDALRRVDHASFRGGFSPGDDVQLIDDVGSDGSVQKSLTTGFSLGTDYGVSGTSIDWMDVNGDGLLDAIIRSDASSDHNFAVKLNYGYRLGPAMTWPAQAWSTSTWDSATGVIGKTAITQSLVTSLVTAYGGVGVNGIRMQDNGTNNLNVGVGAGTGGIGGSAGAGWSWGVSRTLVDLIDVNGDGLPDQVLRRHGDQSGGTPFVRVRLNMGDHFADSDTFWKFQPWAIPTPDDFSFAGDINDALAFRRSTAFTASFSFKVCFFLCVGASGFYENGSGWSHSEFQDFDGDGRPDMVFKDKDDSTVLAKLNLLPQELNLLTKVNRPLGGSFEVQYDRKGNLVRRDLSIKQDEPGTKHVLSRVDVNDGFNNHYVTRFSYDQAGFHDRIEREDYGFAKVTTARIHPADDSIYATTEANYNNQDFYRKALPSSSIVRDASNNVFEVQSYTYASDDRCSNLPNSSSPFPAQYPAEAIKTIAHYEGTSKDPNSTPPVSTTESRTWDCLGNLTDMIDAGDTGLNNDVSYHVDYADQQLLGAKIYKPSRVTAKDHTGKMMRDRSAKYDSHGALLTMNEIVVGGVDPITGLPNTGDPATNPTWTYAYDAYGNVIKTIDPRGYTLNYIYDTPTQTYRTQVSDSFGYASTSVTDLRFGKMASETDVNGGIANFNYDEFGRLSSVDGPYDVGTSNHTISFQYSEAGWPASGTGSNPVPAYAITANRDIQHPTQPIVTSTFSDGLNRIIQTKKNLAQDLGTGPQVGMQVSGAIVYDDQGRLIRQYRPFFDATQPPTVRASQTTFLALTNEYDVLDRAVLTKTPLSGPAGQEADTFATTSTSYGFGTINNANRLQTTISDANVKASTPTAPLPGSDEVELRGVRGDVLRVTEKNRLAGSATPTTLITSYGYDALGQLLSVTDAKSNVTRATYDTTGRLVTLVNPDAGRTDFEFDLSGNLAAKQTSNLATGFQLIRYEYDFNRLKKINYPNSTDVTYDYGTSTEAGPIAFNRASRIKLETSEAGTKAYQYDALGNINHETWTLNRLGTAPPVARSLAYDYDSFGRLLAVYYPGASAEKVSYGYDAGGNLDTVTGVTKKGITNNYVQHIGYDQFEQKTLLKVGNGITTTYSYHPFTRRLSGISASERDPALVQAGLPARPFQQVAYQYDPVGNVTQIANAVPFDATQTGSVKVGPVTENFAYDDLYQLKTADGLHQTSATDRYHYGESLTYDSISNVVQKAQVSETQKLSGTTVTQTTTRTDQTFTSAYTYPTTVHPHAPSEVDDTVPGSSTLVKRAFSYDKNGNQSSWQRTTGTPTTRNVTYSDDNRATKVVQGNVTLQEALYDGAGQRLVKRANGTSQTAYFGQYLTVRDEVPATKHIFAGDVRVASKFVPSEANEECAACSDRASVTYFHDDQLGSTTFATDEVQNLVAHEQYFPSGELWVDQSSDTNHTRQPYLFNGKELDAETGLYYFGARYYDPRLGLWTTPDPILAEYMQGETNHGVHLPQNLALYSYGWNNPVTIRDPNGKCPMCITALVGAAIGGAIGGGVYLARAAITGGDVTARGLAGATVGGAITGAVAGLTGGASLAVQVGAGAAAGAVGGIASRGIETGDASKTFDPKAIATDAALGGAFAGVAYGVGKGINALKASSKGAATAATEEVGGGCGGGLCSGETGCFVAGTLVATERGEVPIEQLRVGERVTAGNAECTNEHLSGDARTIHLTMPDPTHPFERLELDVVRPISWLNEQGFDAGNGWIELRELGMSGWATVTGIDPAPREQPGTGCLVVTTLQHVASQVLRIHLHGMSDALELTPTHPLFAEGLGWTSAADLAPGMYLRTDTGSIAIDSIEVAAPNQRVYNLEVGLEHAYRVGDAEVWAHNVCPVKPGDAGAFKDLDARRVVGDKLTPHHMPQAAAGFTSRAEGGALVLPEAEHALTRTFGGKGAATARAEAGLPFRKVLARDIRDIRQNFGGKYDKGLRDLLQYYKTNFPHLMQKK